MEQSWTLECLLGRTDIYIRQLRKNQSYINHITKTLSFWSTHDLFALPEHFSFPSMNAIHDSNTKSFQNLLDHVKNQLSRLKELQQSLKTIRKDLEYLHDRNTKISYEYKYSLGKLERDIEYLEKEQKSGGSQFKHELVRKDRQKLISEYSELQHQKMAFEKEAHRYFNEAVKKGHELAHPKEGAFTFKAKNQPQHCCRQVSSFEEENLLGKMDENIAEQIRRLEQEVVARFLEAPLVESIQSQV